MKNIVKRVSLIVLAIAISLSIIGNKALYIAGLFVTCLSIVTLIIIEGEDDV